MPTLSYESSIPGTLMPGERVLWDAQPHPPAAKRQWALLAIVLVTLPTAAAIIAGVATHGDSIFAAIAAGVILLLTVIALIVSRRNEILAAREMQHVRYRVTNRRAIRADDRPRRAPDAAQAGLDRIDGIMIHRGPSPAITIGDVCFEHVPDPTPVMLLVLERWSRSGRRKKLRRTPVSDANVHPLIEAPLIGATTPPLAPSEQATPARERSAPATSDDLPPEIALAPNERVLWLGRPRPRDPRDRAWVLARLKTLAWLMIPTALLVSAVGGLPPWAPRAHWAVGAFGAIWLLIGLYVVTVDPMQQARRRERTLYVLTNIRAITHVAGDGGHTRSLLLDTVNSLSVHRGRGGGGGASGTSEATAGAAAADLWIGSAFFDRIPDADRAHAIALEAVRLAGTPWGGFTPPDDIEPDEIEGLPPGTNEST
jgi:membrane protein YdbS with pleckstrin-like domain